MNNKNTTNVIYYGDWHLWHVCPKCDHQYGKEKPLHSHWGGCCPSCGVSGELCPPDKKMARRFACTKKAYGIKKLFGDKDTGFFEFKDIQNDSDGSGGVIFPALKIRSIGRNTTNMALGAFGAGLF